MRRNFALAKVGAWLAGVALLALAVGGCGGGGGGGGATTSGTVTTGISDPATSCTAPAGPYTHVWVTVSDVKAHINSSANPGDSGFQDLTPDLASAPKQVDLLSTSVNSECFLATLGSTSGLPPGTYQQIRILLLANSAPAGGVTAPSPNQCAAAGVNVFNCVVDSGGTHTLDLPSEAKTGIKIPPGQLSHGGLTIAAGQGLDLDIDFNTCTSVVQRGGSGKFNLKPTLRASEVGTSPLIAGNVVLASVAGTAVAVPTPSASPVPGANVWLEQQSHPAAVGTPSAGASQVTVENLIQTTLTDTNGHFAFCPVATGTYELVANAESLPGGAGSSNATIATGVNVTSSGGPNNLVIPLVAEPTASPSPATIEGQVSTTSASPPGAGDLVTVTGMQPFSSGGGTVQALIPFFSTNTVPVPPVVETTSDGTGTGGPDCSSLSLSCPPNTNCACYNLSVPASNPVVGAANSDGSGYAAPAASPVDFRVDAAATAIGGSTPECSPSELASDAFAVTSGGTASAPLLSFTGCD